MVATDFIPPAASTALQALQAVNRNGSTNSTNIPGGNDPNNARPYLQPAVQPSSVINLANSSDVVIGPMTQYQGPVTIYQYMDATVESRAMSAGGGINNQQSVQQASILHRLSTSKLFLAVLVVLIAIIGIVVYIEVEKLNRHNQERIDSQKQNILFGNNYETGTFPNLGNGHLVIDREQWGTSEQTKNLTVPLIHPVPYVLITHVGVQSTPCFNVYKCSIKMRTLQDAAIAEKDLPDIQANFYVGNDGNVYVGRGWNYANTYANKTIAVTFMGDYIRSKPEERQLEAVQFLLAYGVTNKYIAIDYKLVAQNQTKKTRSPGANVYREIIKWPHWYPCGIKDNPKCGVEVGLAEEWDGRM